MSLQPSSSSSAPPTSDGNYNDRHLEPRTDLNYVITRLCNSASISIDGEDVCSHTFVERVMEYVEQDLALVKGIRTSEAKRRPFNYGSQRGEYGERQPPPGCHSNGHDIASEMNEVVVDDPILPCPCPEIITISSSPHHVTYPDYSPPPSSASYVTFYVPTPVETAQDTPQNGDDSDHDNAATSPDLSPTLPREAHQSVPTLDDLGQSSSERGENSETRSPPPTYHSNCQNTSSALSQLAHNENSEFVEPTTVLSPAMSIVSFPMTPSHPDVISISSTSHYGASPSPSSSPFCVISSTYHVQTPAPSETDMSQQGHNDNHDDVTPPALSPILLSEDPPSTFQPQNTNEAENVAFVAGEDNFVNELINPTPSTSRQLRPRKSNPRQSNTSSKKKASSQRSGKKKRNEESTKQQAMSKRKHEYRTFKNGFYRCNCGSKFSSLGAQKYHLNYFTSEWKFSCDECIDKFYDLSKLKTHLSKKHKRINPLAEYEIGCTLCGIPFHTRAEFNMHRKEEHLQLLQPRLLARSPRYHGMSTIRPAPKQPWRTPGRHRMTPARTEPDSSSENRMLMSPQDEEIDVEQNVNAEVNPNRANTDGLVKDEEEVNKIVSRQSSSQQANLSPFSQQSESGNSVVESIAGINGLPIEERQIDEINLINSSAVEEEENHMDAFQTSSQQTASGLPPPMVKQEHYEDFMDENSMESGNSSNVSSNRSDYVGQGKLYTCITCNKAFRDDLSMLIKHLLEQHNSLSRKVKCGSCGLVCRSAGHFGRHWVRRHKARRRV